MFALATAFATPKLFIHVFIGAKLFELAEKGEKMGLGTKAVNYVSIVTGGIIGIVTGLLIYRRYTTPLIETFVWWCLLLVTRTIARARELEAEERAQFRESENNGPRIFSNDSEQDAAAAALLNNDDLDLHEGRVKSDAYRDDFTDDLFFGGSDNDDEEEEIGLTTQGPRSA